LPGANPGGPRGFFPRGEAPQPQRKNGILGSLLALLVVGFKYFKILLGSGKFLVFGKTLLTMAISLGFYASAYGWSFAAIFILLLFIHEMGHVWAAKRIGLKVSAPMFIPFMGALITLRENPRSAAHEAYVAVGGPILGTLGSMAVFTLACLTNSAFLFHMAAVGFFLNLFNLIPVSPLDGGRIVAAVSPWLWLVGALIMVPLLIWMQAYLFLVLVVFMAGPQVRRLFEGKNWQWKVYHTCTKRQRLYASSALLSLAITLAAALFLCTLGAHYPGNALTDLGMIVAWPICGLIAGICVFTWPLEQAGQFHRIAPDGVIEV
jgi:Zn-dependent protease